MNNDFSILSALREGDSKAFDILFNHYYSSLCNYAFSIVHNQDAAEDIVQEMFADIWINCKKLLIRSSLKSYLYHSAYNACLDYFKHNRARGRYEANVLQQKLPEFDDSLITAEMLEQIERSIEQLPEQCRKIFKLSRFENLKYREIACLLEISENTVDTQIRRALNKLKKDLSEYLTILFLIICNFF